MIAPAKKEQLMQMLVHLGRGSGSDFIALAEPASVHRGLKWDVLIGSRSARIGHMKLKSGIGLGGMALRHGIYYQANHRENPAMLTECPVMLAEKLASGIAFPISAAALSSVQGILLLGRRADQPYARQEIAFIQSFIPHFVEIMNAGAL